MCNGLSAENTILTCNALSEGVDFLESHGFNGRVQVDQPPMFTEFEGGKAFTLGSVWMIENASL